MSVQITLEYIRSIEEGQKFLIDGILHVCNMSSGYMVNDSKNFRFSPTNHLTPNGQDVEYYLPDVCLLRAIENKELTFVLVKEQVLEQLRLF